MTNYELEEKLRILKEFETHFGWKYYREHLVSIRENTLDTWVARGDKSADYIRGYLQAVKDLETELKELIAQIEGELQQNA